jgi:RNA polymerase sigma-70 factor (ECF subfamily)
MSQTKNENKQTADVLEEIYRAQARHVFATLVRLLGDFDLAEEALHEAFRAALEQWPKDGVFFIGWLKQVQIFT